MVTLSDDEVALIKSIGDRSPKNQGSGYRSGVGYVVERGNG
ncbi:MAG: hypothetical protein VKK42_09460 [Lyngbya sp.]|nr:hypothetical protein [Lyngbya sp.]